MLCDHLEGWDREGGSRGRGYWDICMHIADSFCCTAETNNTVKQLCANKDIFKKKRALIFFSYTGKHADVKEMGEAELLLLVSLNGKTDGVNSYTEFIRAELL